MCDRKFEIHNELSTSCLTKQITCKQKKTQFLCNPISMHTIHICTYVCTYPIIFSRIIHVSIYVYVCSGLIIIAKKQNSNIYIQ